MAAAKPKVSQAAPPSRDIKGVAIGAVVGTILTTLVAGFLVTTKVATKLLLTDAVSKSIADQLKEDSAFQQKIRGNPGPPGPPGSNGLQGVAGHVQTAEELIPLIKETISGHELMYFATVTRTSTLAAPPGTTTKDWAIFVMPLSLGRRPTLGQGFHPQLPASYTPGPDVSDRYLDQVTCYATVLNEKEWNVVAEQVLSGIPIIQPDRYIGIDVCCLLFAPPRK